MNKARKLAIEIWRTYVEEHEWDLDVIEKTILKAYPEYPSMQENIEKFARRDFSCNRHEDCKVAEEKYLKTYKLYPPLNFHCHSEDCEDCFGC